MLNLLIYPFPHFYIVFLCVINVEPVDLSLPSFLYCVSYDISVEPVDLLLPSILVF
jgi:hypothetical protein